MLTNLLVNIVASFVALYIGSKLISARLPATKLLSIAVLGQVFLIYALPFVMSVVGMVPLPRMDMVLEALVWLGLVNFVVPRTSPKEYIVLGLLAFGANILVGYIGII